MYMYMEHKNILLSSRKKYFGCIKGTEGVCEGLQGINVRGPRTVQERMGGILIKFHQWRQGSMHLVCVTRSCAPYTVSIFEAGRTGGVPRRTTASSALCRCGAHAFEKGAEMTQTRCGNNLQAFGGHCFAPSQTDHRRIVIGRHQRASGGKTTHEGNAPQRTIDRHGHLDCPHRGREAGSSRSVTFLQLGGKKGERTPVSY